MRCHYKSQVGHSLFTSNLHHQPNSKGAEFQIENRISNGVLTLSQNFHASLTGTLHCHFTHISNTISIGCIYPVLYSRHLNPSLLSINLKKTANSDCLLKRMDVHFLDVNCL